MSGRLEDQKAVVSPTPTVKTQLNRIRGFSLDILACLQETGGATIGEIVEVVGKPPNYIRSYLYNLFSYGCIYKTEFWGWTLTNLGYAILNNNNNNNNNVGKRKAKEEQNKSKRRAKENNSNRQLDLNLYLENPGVTDPERVIVTKLIDHYERTSEKYRFFSDMYSFCESFGLSAIGITELLAKLREEGIIYIREEKMLGMWKIGLKKNFIERLEYC